MLGWGYPPDIDGGLDIHVAHLFDELEEKGVEIELAVLEEHAPKKSGVIPIRAEGDSMMEKASDISNQVVELAEDFDIVHTHDWFGSESGLKAKKYSGSDWVATFHSLSTGRSRNPSRRVRELERAAAERADRVLAVSSKLASELEEEFGTEAEVIHNGFSSPENSGIDVKEELDIENYMLLYIGRHAEQKGLEHLLYGFKKFLQEGGDATLVVGGEGHMKGSLKEFAEIMGIEDNVIFAGYIPDDRLGDYYSSADVFVSPAINEPFGLTLTEAVESGTTVVATESGAEEVLPDNAIVRVEPESDSIARGIEKALDREVPGFESRSWGEVAEETAEIYEKVSR